MSRHNRRYGRQINKAAMDFMQSMQGAGSMRQPGSELAIAQSFGATGANSTSLGPGVPPAPYPLDATGEARSWQYRVGWNIPSIPGMDKNFGFDTLRALADTYAILRKAIELRKDEVATWRFDIIAREPDKRKAQQIIGDQQDLITEIKDFFTMPDKQHTLQSWLREALEEYFVIDALAIDKRQTLGGGLHSLRCLDGSTIKPLVAINGDRPEPPNPAYQQFMYGTPVYEWSADQLIYAPKNRRVFTPYGFSPVEQFVWHVTTCLKFDRFTLDFFTDGTLPEGVAEVPLGWTIDQIKDFQALWDGMVAGDTRAFHRLHFVGSGFKFHAFKPFTFEDVFARWLVEVTACAMDVTMQQLGFEPKNSGLGGSGFAEKQHQVQQDKSRGPLKRWLLDEVINPLIWTDFEAPTLQGTFMDEDEQQNESQEAAGREIDIRNGIRSIDQIVEEDGGTPPGIGRLYALGNVILGEPDLIAISQKGSIALGLVAKPGEAPAGGSLSGASAGQMPPGVHPVGKPVPIAASQEQEPPEDTGKVADMHDELKRFLRFVSKRRETERWRDYQSEVFTPETLTDLNRAARTGATPQELEGLAGLERYPAHLKEQVTASRESYADFTKRLSQLVAAKLGAKEETSHAESH